MIFITGDTHGEFSNLLYFIKKMELNSDDMIIILGDAGFNYYKGKGDIEVKKLMNDTNVKIFCIHGNHERRPSSISSYYLTDFCGGKVYVEKAFPNLMFAKDGEIFDINGLKTIVIGGAYSVDKYYRLAKGYNWFEDEQPSKDIKEFVEKQLASNNWNIDVVLSHTCPKSLEPTEWFLDFIDQSLVDKSTEEWLEEIRQKLNYKYWFCGHFHGIKKIPEIEFFFDNIKEFPKLDKKH